MSKIDDAADKVKNARDEVAEGTTRFTNEALGALLFLLLGRAFVISLLIPLFMLMSALSLGTGTSP